MIEQVYLEQLLASVVVLIAVYVFYHVLDGQFLGPEDTFWNELRPSLLPALDSYARKIGFFTLNRAYESEFVATVEADLPSIERWLHDMGYDRNPMAGLKYRGNLEDEDFEVTTWAYRESDNSLIPDPLAFWQTHVFVFDNGDGTFDLYAHYEYSSMNPLVAYKHVRGIGMDRERGVGYVLRNLEQNSGLDVVDVAGMWGSVTEAAPER